jgi:hypothetical protein
MKTLSNLTTDDFVRSPIWEFALASDELLYALPAKELPVFDLKNRLVGTKVKLNNGIFCWAILGNINLSNKLSTEHFLTLSLERNGGWFDLARYHDVDYSRRSAMQLSKFLSFSVDEVFPIKYDISAIAVGIQEVIVGEIVAEVKKKLSQSELIKLAIDS